MAGLPAKVPMWPGLITGEEARTWSRGHQPLLQGNPGTGLQQPLWTWTEELFITYIEITKIQ